MFFTTPAVMALYKPARKPVPYKTRKLEGIDKKDQLRILACVHGTTRNTTALLNLVEACKGTTTSGTRLKPQVKLFAMHLIELSLDRPSSILSLSRSVTAEQDEIVQAMAHDDDNTLIPFKTYGQISKVPVRLLQAVSQLSDMHHDICESAVEKRATMILLPCNVQLKEHGTLEHINLGLKAMNERVMENAPCSVAVLLDKGQWGSAQLSVETDIKVGVVFRGGSDDREALAFGCRLAGHTNVKVWILRFKPNEASHVINITRDDCEEHDLDEQTLVDIRENNVNKNNIIYEECPYNTLDSYPKDVVASTKVNDFSLIVVGHGQYSNSEKSELGHVGEALAKISSGGTKASILVIQQHKKEQTNA